MSGFFGFLRRHGHTTTPGDGGFIDTSGGGGSFDPRTEMLIYDECFQPQSHASYTYGGGIVESIAGTGADVVNADNALGSPDWEADHPGILALQTGTTTTGRAALTSASAVLPLAVTGGAARFGVVARIPVLSNGTDRFIVRAGWGHTIANNDTHTGVFFRYSDNVNGGRWQGVCIDGLSGEPSAVESDLDTGATADTAWHTFEHEVNAAGTSVEFFIDGVSVGTITTHIPDGQTFRQQFCPLTIKKSAGTTAVEAYIDAYWYRWALSR